MQNEGLLLSLKDLHNLGEDSPRVSDSAECWSDSGVLASGLLSTCSVPSKHPFAAAQKLALIFHISWDGFKITALISKLSMQQQDFNTVVACLIHLFSKGPREA